MAELDGSQLVCEMYEKHKMTLNHILLNINSSQLAMVFTRLEFETKILTRCPVPYYIVWEHGNHDQIRLTAWKL